MTPNVDNLMTLATRADFVNNYEEAYKYFTQVLEIDVSNAAAWHGRGKAAGSLSTAESLRLREMRVAFDEAMRLTPEEQLPAMKEQCARDAGAIAKKCFGLALDDMTPYDRSGMQARIGASWPSHLSRCREIVETYEYCLSLSPRDIRYMKGIVDVYRNNVNGYFYNHVDGTPGGRYDLRLEKPAVLEKAEYYTNLIRQVEPDYHPKMALPSQSGCFVVTATMGDEQHPTVTTLRAFRDEHLRRFAAGRRFIDWYSLRGPEFADGIRSSRFRRMAAYVLVVAPAATMVRSINLVQRRLRRTKSSDCDRE